MTDLPSEAFKRGYSDCMNYSVEQDFEKKPEPYPTQYMKGHNRALKDIKEIEKYAKLHDIPAAYPLGKRKNFLIDSSIKRLGSGEPTTPLEMIDAYYDAVKRREMKGAEYFPDIPPENRLANRPSRQEREQKRYKDSYGSYKHTHDPEIESVVFVATPDEMKAGEVLMDMKARFKKSKSKKSKKSKTNKSKTNKSKTNKSKSKTMK